MRVYLWLLVFSDTVRALVSFEHSPDLVALHRIRTPGVMHPVKSSSTLLVPYRTHPLRTTHISFHSLHSRLITLRGGGAVEDLVGPAYDWCMNLGAPAALVAGAVVATLYENVRGGALEIRKGDSAYNKLAKKLTTLLLLTAFAFQIVSIFVTTVTGTMLLTEDVSHLKITATTALGFMREHYEFEYLTARLSFLQGLLNWLAAVAVEHTIPREDEGQAAMKMNNFVASSLVTLILLLLGFYNRHLTFYANYGEMCHRWLHVAFHRFVGQWPPRKLAFLYVPSSILTLFFAVRALKNDPVKEQ